MKNIKFNKVSDISEQKILNSLSEIESLRQKLFDISNDTMNIDLNNIAQEMFDHIQTIKNNL